MYNILIITLLLIASQTFGQSSTQSFSKVVVDGNIIVTFRPDDMHDVDAIVDTDDLSYSVNNGTLVISRNSDAKWSDAAQVTVNFTSLTSIKASNRAVISCEGLLSSDSLSLMANKKARFELIVGCNLLTAFLSNGSEITLSGKVESFKADLSNKSILDAPTLEADVVHIKTDSESAATVFALSHIEATASTNSTIKVLGNPKSQNVSEQSGGTVQ